MSSWARTAHSLLQEHKSLVIRSMATMATQQDQTIDRSFGVIWVWPLLVKHAKQLGWEKDQMDQDTGKRNFISFPHEKLSMMPIDMIEYGLSYNVYPGGANNSDEGWMF
ncbi:hypothetical protein ABZP36_026943 [Zizania latifolia]